MKFESINRMRLTKVRSKKLQKYWELNTQTEHNFAQVFCIDRVDCPYATNNCLRWDWCLFRVATVIRHNRSPTPEQVHHGCGSAQLSAIKLVIVILNWMWAATGSQWRYQVKCENSGRVKARCAALDTLQRFCRRGWESSQERVAVVQVGDQCRPWVICCPRQNLRGRPLVSQSITHCCWYFGPFLHADLL